MAAGHFRTQGPGAIADRNRLRIDGPTEGIRAVEPIEDRFRAFGWARNAPTMTRGWRR